MIGSIIGAGVSGLSSLFGGLAKRKAAAEQEQKLREQERDNEMWYNRRYNEDPLQRASAQAMLTRVAEGIKARNRQAEGTKAVMGGTDASVAAAREANNEGLSKTASAIVANDDARKDRIEENYRAAKRDIDGQKMQAAAAKQAAVTDAAIALGQTAGQIAGQIGGLQSGKSTKAALGINGNVAQPAAETAQKLEAKTPMQTLGDMDELKKGQSIWQGA